MNFNKRIKNIYQIGNNLIDKEKNFNKNYIRIYEGHKEIYKKHHLLKHAFNLSNIIRKKNNEININKYLEETRKEKNKFNIYNFEKDLNSKKTKKLYSLNDELLKILLSKINKKNDEEILKKEEEKILFQSLSLKGIRKRNNFSNTHNTIKSFKTSDNLKDFNNDISKKDFYITPNKNKNILFNHSINSVGKISEKYEHPTKFYFYNLQDKLKIIIQRINSEGKNNSKDFDLLKNNFSIDLNKNRKIKFKDKTINTERIIKPKTILKNIQKIKRKKDLENLLFKESNSTFNKVKKQLYTLYQFPNKFKIPTD